MCVFLLSSFRPLRAPVRELSTCYAPVICLIFSCYFAHAAHEGCFGSAWRLGSFPPAWMGSNCAIPPIVSLLWAMKMAATLTFQSMRSPHSASASYAIISRSPVASSPHLKPSPDPCRAMLGDCGFDRPLARIVGDECNVGSAAGLDQDRVAPIGLPAVVHRVKQ